ncbi:MAG: type II toxin-antitoxin system VapC family toxin [bacterium]|nr:type II toxin-antitoxin system VapC family toxin [bacterium]
MAGKSEAYVDTSALIALCDRSDTHHALFRRLFSDPPVLITTALVVGEGHAWFARRFDSTRGLRFLAMIEAMKPLRTISIGRREQGAATELLRRFPDQRMTLADAVGLHVMQARKIRSCWSTDRHLGLTGVPLVIHKGGAVHDRRVRQLEAAGR